MKCAAVFISMLAAASLFAQLSVSPGAKMPAPSVEWINQKPAELPPTDMRKQIDILVFLDMATPDALQFLNMLDTMNADFSVEKKAFVRISVVVANDVKTTRDILEKAKASFSIPIGCDIKRKTFNLFAIASTPYAFAAKDQAIIWSGHPVDLEYIVESAINGTFSQNDFRQLSRYRRDMQSALHSGLPEVAGESAEKALKYFPTDMLALQTRLYAFQRRGRYNDAVRFLSNHIKKHPQADRHGIRILLLDMVVRSGDYSNWDKIVQESIKKTAGFPERELTLAAFLLTRAPFERVPAKEVLTLSEKALNGLKNGKKPALYADALEIAARANHLSCRLDKAVAYQEEAIRQRIRLQDQNIGRAQQALRFYLSLKKL